MDFKKNPNADFRDVDNLEKKEAKEQVEALREGIEYHDYRYYVENDPEISDALYDRLFHRLQELEEAFPDLQSENSPTQRVGAEPVDELKAVEHTARDMGCCKVTLEVLENNHRALKVYAAAGFARATYTEEAGPALFFAKQL